MVFESLVVEILNTFLRDYVNDLDSSKLRLGIWGGDAVLEELEIKESSLSQLGIPFKVKVGQIKRLELKIPWKKLYTQSVEATLDGVYLLLVPAAHIRYDAEKEEKQLQDTRQRELKRIEETKRKAAEQESPTQEKQNTFIEKLITQVIKNLQVKISNIHIRYEDDMTNPSCPLSFGVSLKDLRFHTADENWEPCLLDENTKHFFKLVQLNNLFAYWNVNSLLYSNKSRGEAQQCLHNSVPSSQDVLFHLMTADAKLQMNPRSDVDFSSPKVDLAVNLPAVAIELNRPQYLNILEFTESVYMMARNLPYRKYRPEVRIHTNAPIWWRYAITGILEVDVKRRLHMWSWQHIHRHRRTVKRYRDLYKDKITSNKALGELLKELEDTEGTLDIFNITLARQQAEMEASKAGLRVYRPGMKMEAEESQGWFGWVWKWGGERETRVTQVKTGAFDDLMTPAEKAKLYAAIGYSEDPVNHNLPKDFEDMKVDFHMKTLSVSFKDNNTDRNEIFKMTVGELTTILTQRSGAQAIKLIAKLNMFEVTGLASDRTTPTLLSSRNAATGTLLSIEFETNPLDETADQRLYIESQPLEIIYDAITVNSMSEFFFPPENLQLDQLTNVTLMKLEQFRDRTASGLMYVIKTQKVLDLNVNLLASYVIIPQTGFYDSTQNVMVLDLGDLKVSSQSKKDLPQLSVGSSAIGDIMDRAYDSFDVQLNSLQFLYSKPDGDWKKARKQKQSALHILEPVDLKVVFSRAMVVTDSRMAKFKISGELPLLSLCISDDRIRGVLDLINSIPVPNRKPAPCRPASKREDLVKKDPQKNMTDFLVTFEINEMSIKLCHLSDGREVTVLHLDIEGVGTELKLLTFDMFSYTFVREICLKCPEYVDSQGKEVHLITTLDNMEDDLLTLEYIKADRNGPEFESQHKNTEQLIKVNFSSLDMHLYTEPILNIMNIFKSLPPFSWCMEEGQEEDKRRKKEEPMIAKRHTSNKSTFEDVVNLHIRTELNCLKVFIEGEKGRISEISIEGLGSEVLLRKKKMEVLANLKNIVVLDCVKDAIYKNVVSIADKEVFAFHMVNYTDATVGDAYLDMSKVDTSITLTVGSIQVIILNKFISSILAFINNFQQVKPAEKAAIGMFEAELAKHSTRIALNVHFNTPVIFLPHSSSSNVIVAHLGLISIKNHFAKMSSKTHSKIPPVVDKMTVGLNDLRMYRTTHEADQFQGETQLLKPVSMDLSISRNLSSTWYHDIPDIEITGHLKTVTLMQSQADMTLLLITLNEVLSQPSDAGKPSDTVPAPPNKFKNTLKLNFKFDSMTLVLYSPTANEVELLDCHDEQQKLAEFTLETISISLHTYSGSSLKGSFKVANCLLDDKNPRIKMVTPTMMAMHPSAKQNMIMEVNYCEGRDGITLDTVIQDLYLCASMEFLLKVADIFLKATEQGFAPASQPKATNRRGDKKNGTDPTSTNAAGKVVALNINVLVRNPEIVFVADLTRANSPALVMRVTQCELVQKNDAEGLQTTAVIKDLNVVACPFLWDKRRNNVTMVLQPCQVFYQGNQASTSPPAMEVCVNALSIKVSPTIINTVITIIHSVLTPNAETPQELNSPVPLDLWEQRSWKELKLWFLEDEVDENAQYLAPLMPQGESLQVAINSICLTVEAGVGHGTVPMLLAKSSFHADVKNWSTFINFHGQLNLEVNYYNEMVGVWEPFLEPLEGQLEDARPWTLQLQIKKMPVKYTGISSEVDFNVPDFKTVINISSKDHLNITLSKCGLGMLSNLHMAFVEAATQTTECFQKDEAPFVVKNCLGLPVSVLYSEMFSPTDGEGTNRTMELQDGESLNLDYSSTGNDSAIISLSEIDYYIQPTPLGHTSASVMPLIKVGRGMYSVMHSKSGVTRFVVCHIYSVEGNKYIKIHSPFQIINHFSIPFKVFEGSTCLGVSLPNEEFCVPLDSYRSELSLQPVTDEGEGGQAIEFECSEGFSYEEVSKQEPGTRLQRICCHCGKKGGVLMINIVSLRDAVTSKHTGCVGENFDEPYILHLWPSILLRNLLPYMITYKLQKCGDIAPEATLKPGHSAQLHTAVINQSSLTLCLLDYLVQNWSAEYSLLSEQEEFTFIVFKSLSKDNKDGASGGTERKRAELHIAVHVKYDPGQTVVAIYSPYWMENKTGRLLQYKADDIFFKHPLDYDMPLLFSFKPQNFLEKNKVRLMISDSELSQEFSLDTVGNYGDIKCKGRYKDYQVGVKIDASSFGLTRCVTFLPFYLLVNRTKHTIWISEQGQENWTQAQPEQPAIPFWPERNTRYLKIKVEGCESPPQTIDFTRPENCLLLHLDKTLGGITVDVNLSEHSTVIHFSDYYDGAAPFLIINHTKDQVLQFYQSSQKKKEQLEPGKAVYYTWTEPTGSRELRWICGSYHHTLKSEGDVWKNMNDDGKLFLISFYEGLQRVVLFTGERQIYKYLCKCERAKLADKEIILSLQDVGVSLVNNTTGQEVSFIGITSSNVLWGYEEVAKSRWKALGGKAVEMLENSYREYKDREPLENATVELAKNFQVSLTPNDGDMKLLQPFKARLRRTFLPGVKVEYSVSSQQRSYRIQINRIQIQNQLPGAIFPFVFSPVKLPRSVTEDSRPKPLTDICIVTRAAGHSNISRIKYFKVLIQEMDLKLDLGFLNAIRDLFTPENASIATSEQEVELFEKDIEYILSELNHVSAADTSPISLYEYFHISPIKLHLSFSMSTGGENGRKKRNTELFPIQSLNLLLKSIGATLTDVQDVVFKLAFFEMTFQFCTTQQLQREVESHYKKQALKQMYVLVFGLDVLGNPFGLIRGLSKGVKTFFYEPYQGAIQGPEEFVEGMALGVKALVGSAVEGIAGTASRIAGTASRITGAVAKSLADLTMDEKYQQERQSRGGDALLSGVTGIVSGMTGIVSKPIEGAQKNGATGFFKGVVKGLVGAVAKPAGGIIDMFGSTFQGIQRVAEPSKDIESLRPPRFIHDDGVIRPYKEREAIGRQMLQEIVNGRFALYRYFAHAKIDDSNFLMITKRGILFVTKGTRDKPTCEWQYRFDEFTKDPRIINGQCLCIEAEEKGRSILHSKEGGSCKIIKFKNPDMVKWVLVKLEEARKQEPDCNRNEQQTKTEK